MDNIRNDGSVQTPKAPALLEPKAPKPVPNPGQKGVDLPKFSGPDGKWATEGEYKKLSPAQKMAYWQHTGAYKTAKERRGGGLSVQSNDGSWADYDDNGHMIIDKATGLPPTSAASKPSSPAMSPGEKKAASLFGGPYAESAAVSSGSYQPKESDLVECDGEYKPGGKQVLLCKDTDGTFWADDGDGDEPHYKEVDPEELIDYIVSSHPGNRESDYEKRLNMYNRFGIDKAYWPDNDLDNAYIEKRNEDMIMDMSPSEISEMEHEDYEWGLTHKPSYSPYSELHMMLRRKKR